MTQSTYAVTGMTCGHCAASVGDTSESALVLEHVESAVRVAGYQLVR
ncbi:hypothetical protein [Amycolatopsis sp. NPDC051371]